jgi:hypothetical protein
MQVAGMPPGKPSKQFKVATLKLFGELRENCDSEQLGRLLKERMEEQY